MTKEIVINSNGDTIPITAEKIENEHIISIDGVEWVKTSNILHATVLFNMLADHVTEYMTYELK